MDVEYFESPVFQGVLLFRCERLRADLTPTCCARNFASATAFACRNCPVGQRHAEVLSLGAQSKDAPASCVRCGRDGLRGAERMVGRFRLVRGNTLCVSCFNREREVLHGKNSKGGRPVKWNGLREAHVEIEQGGTMRRIDIGLCSGRTEAERVAARRWPGCIIKRFWLDPEPPPHVPTHRPIAASGASQALAAGF